MIILIWCLFFIGFSFGASVFKCSSSDLKFEKVLGLRPPNSTLSTLLYQSDTNTILRPVTSECIAKCLARDDCSSFVLYYSVSKCYYYDGTNVSFTDDSDNVIDENVAWFIKKCLVTDTSCSKLWVFDRIPGATLIGNDTRILPGAISRTDCEQYCLNETQFICRSAKFSITQTEYRSSTGVGGYSYGANNSVDYTGSLRGACILSDTDRQLLPSSYRVSSYGDEYFENQCAPTITNSNEFCAYEEYENMTSSHNDIMFERKTKEECQKMCDTFQAFNCKSFTIINGSTCYLHSEDTKIYGPNSLRIRPGAVYYEKANCLNISVTCTETYMTVKYKPEVNFKGTMYMEGFSDNSVCSANGQGGYDTVSLQIPLLTGQCGIIKADGPINRTLFSGNLLLQFNSLIQTQNDRLIRVGCIFGNETKVVIGTGVHVSPMLPNRGSVIIIPGGNTSLPNVIMKVLDAHSGNEVSDSQIGQDLQLQIILNKPENLDIWASHLIAMTEKNDESIFLLDEKGCPTDLNVFPPLKKIVQNDYIELVATFKAFKFSDSPIVRFSVIIQFCVGTCPPINCPGNVISYGRRKRETRIETINGTTIVKLNRTDAKQKSSLMFEMPLEYIMVVRDSTKYTSDRLVIGDHKILVAGYDFAENEVCLNYSLVIALIILWILVQVLFFIGFVVLVRRYKRYYQHECTRQSLEELHKNFGLGASNLDNNRRVHWADNENIL